MFVSPDAEGARSAKPECWQCLNLSLANCDGISFLQPPTDAMMLPSTIRSLLYSLGFGGCPNRV